MSGLPGRVPSANLGHQRKPSLLAAGEPWCGADGVPVWVRLTSLGERLYDAQRHAPHKFSEEEEMNIFNDMLNNILTVNDRLADEVEEESEDD